MKSIALQKLRGKLAKGATTFGLWVTLDSPSITEMAVAFGLDWVVIDAEHGNLDWSEILQHVRATVRSDTVALVRIAELNTSLIKRALDIGADGIVVPWVETVEQLELAISSARYPPVGRRGVGGERATCWGACLSESVTEADRHVMVVPIIESVTAGQNIEQLVRVDGIEVFFVGPADYSCTAGYPGHWEGGDVGKQLLYVKETIRAHSKYCGVLATNHENLLQRRDQGFQLLAIGHDAGLLVRALREALVVVGHDRRITPDLEFVADRED